MRAQRLGHQKTRKPFIKFIHKTWTYKIIYLSSPSGYDVIPGGENLIALEVFIRNESKQGELKRQLDPLEYEFIHRWTRPHHSTNLHLSLCLQQPQHLYLLQCEYYSLEGISSLINTINTLKNKNLTDNRVFGIIRTMVDMRNNLAKEVSEELEKHFPSLGF